MARLPQTVTVSTERVILVNITALYFFHSWVLISFVLIMKSIIFNGCTFLLTKCFKNSFKVAEYIDYGNKYSCLVLLAQKTFSYTLSYCTITTFKNIHFFRIQLSIDLSTTGLRTQNYSIAYRTLDEENSAAKYSRCLCVN